MSLTISDDLLQAADLTETDFMIEIAVLLFQQERITLGRASQLCGISQIEFQQLLSSRDICIHYDLEDYQADVQSLQARGWL
jgi:predicted HTH domain antitoxin